MTLNFCIVPATFLGYVTVNDDFFATYQLNVTTSIKHYGKDDLNFPIFPYTF